MKSRTFLGVLVFSAAAAACALGQPSFQLLPAGFIARGISDQGFPPTGFVVVGASGGAPARWTQAGGVQPIGPATYNTARAASQWGDIIVGDPAFLWTQSGGLQPLGGAEAVGVTGVNGAPGITFVVGSSQVGFLYQAWRWNPISGQESLPTAAYPNGRRAVAVSEDGARVLGNVYVHAPGFADFEERAWMWTQGSTQYTELPMPWTGFARAASYGMDRLARAVVGSTRQYTVNGQLVELIDEEAVRWSRSGSAWPPEALGTLPGDARSGGLGVSPDGVVIVGWSLGVGGSRATVWTGGIGMADLKQFLLDRGVTSVAGHTLTRAVAVGGAAGPLLPYVVVGDTSTSASFIASLGSFCLADCNWSGSLTVADFTCFQARYVSLDAYADCNGDAAFTVADFTCFQSAFASGCP